MACPAHCRLWIFRTSPPDTSYYGTSSPPWAQRYRDIAVSYIHSAFSSSFTLHGPTYVSYDSSEYPPRCTGTQLQVSQRKNSHTVRMSGPIDRGFWLLWPPMSYVVQFFVGARHSQLPFEFDSGQRYTPPGLPIEGHVIDSEITRCGKVRRM